MKNPQRAAAARMLKRAQSLGLLTKNGSPLVVDLMEELMAAAAGFRNAHAWRASLEKPTAVDEELTPVLELTAPAESGCDYRLVQGRGCWVEVDQDFLAHIYLQPDGSALTTDLHAKSDAFYPLASATLSREEARNSEGNSEDSAQQTTALHQKLDALQAIGVEVQEDSDQPGLWVWTAPTDGCESSLDSMEEAVEDAWHVAALSVCGMRGLSPNEWKAASLSQQCDWVRDLADD